MGIRRQLVRAAIALAAAGLAVTGAAPAGAEQQTYPGGNGRISYVTLATPNIFGTTVRTADPVSGTTVQFAAGSPGGMYSPDGRRLAYYSWSERRIRVANADGSGNVPLMSALPAGFNIDELVWSPNGQRLAFVRYASDANGYGNGPMDIWTVPTTANSTPVQMTTDGKSLWPTWSPDSQLMAFMSSADGDFEVIMQRPDRSGRQQLTNNTTVDAYPAWSPTGSDIVFATRTATGVGLSQVGMTNFFGTWMAGGTGVISAPTRTGQQSTPVWAPDGSRISVGWPGPEGGITVYTRPIFGGAWPELRTNVNAHLQTLWSPDSRQIAYLLPGPGSNLSIMNADGTNKRQVVTGNVMWLMSWQKV